MAAWIVITTAHLNDYLVAAQVSALRTAALGAGQSDPFTNVMHDRANYVRNRIAKNITLSATAYAVPPELKTATCWLVLEAMQARIALKLTEEQKQLVEDAKKDLDRAATKDFPISTPDDPETPAVQNGGGVSVVSSRTRAATGSKLNGF